MAAHHDDTLGGTSAGGTSAGGSHLGRLRDMDDFKVADGYPDITGWDVKASDGTKIGEVKDLVVDTQAMRARYVDVELDRSIGQLAHDATTPGDQSDDRHVLLPIGDVRLDDTRDDVVVEGYSVAQISGLPRHGGHLTREYESSLRNGLTGAAGAAGAGAMAAQSMHATPSTDDRFDYDADTHRDRYDDQRLFASRRDRTAGATNAGETRLTLSEEQLSVGKRQVEAGEVGVHKTVETEHVRESVPLTHEEVTIERHPVTAGSVSNPNIGEDEIRVPVMREEAVVQKRVVPREEIIVRKHAVTEQQNVDADLRRERLDTSEIDQRDLQGTRGMSGASSAGAAGTSGAADRATHSGLGDRIADKLDDVKDRVDGNPASRPGPDATDRRI